MKPNCYECKHQGKVPGDAHSCCRHPKSGHNGDYIMGLANLMMAAATGTLKNELNIEGDLHGIQCGWFMWPVNFDPTWLRNCDGFEVKK